ncbi:hypothetical protein SpAn4DRAFT_2662 [Sporomusa ovata]|uniref:Uncharacterized protein n=1 Tax=Sporomusa ovata TaxID=2378 RepID=A0A0U1L168_9FIRM|nr:hypothetical protein SpAn4DRAFT_2662 [Sporomusa ovata]
MDNYIVPKSEGIYSIKLPPAACHCPFWGMKKDQHFRRSFHLYYVDFNGYRLYV